MLYFMKGLFCCGAVVVSELLLFLNPQLLHSQRQDAVREFRVMEYNVENLFDNVHDSLKHDMDFTEQGAYYWTRGRYWRKVNAVARAMVLVSERDNKLRMPDIVAFCEVENDSVLNVLTKRSLLAAMKYDYIATSSPDLRGIDVALLYQPLSFMPIKTYPIRIEPIKGMRPTRDILYVKGVSSIDTLHVFVVHAPSRRGGERVTRPYRRVVIEKVAEAVDSVMCVEAEPKIIVMGDFNDYSSDENIKYLVTHHLTEISAPPYLSAEKDVCGTYRYKGQWGSIDHIFVSPALLSLFANANIGYHELLVERDDVYGGVKPFRFFTGTAIHGGYSDHLPLVATFFSSKYK